MAPQPHAQRCIPVGCIRINLADTKLPPALYHRHEFKGWKRFTALDKSGQPFPADPCLERVPPMPNDLQTYLLSSWPRPWLRLLTWRWIEVTFRLSTDVQDEGVIRVYLLPDDKDHRDVDRSDGRLRKARLDLLSKLDFSHEAWRGHLKSVPLAYPVSYDGDDHIGDQDQSLLRMFNNIPSPNPQPELIQDHYAQDAAHELLGDEVAGLETELYDYQRRSAAVMLQRESQPVRVLDPRLVKVLDQHDQPWYFDRVNGYGLLGPRLYDGVNGGILAEEMGAGKTLICLALILATKHQASQVPGIYRGHPIIRRRVGSLADMAAATINKHAMPWKPWFGESGFYEPDYQHCRKYLRKNPGFYYMPRPERKKHTRKPAAVSPMKKVYLSYATLVIVPANLAQQWKQEIAKHTLPGSLRTIVITDSKQVVPPVEELIETEIILFSIPAFERLGLTDAVDHPLTCIHFKRCIVDEGHRFGTSTPTAKSNLLLALDTLQLSARWIVTGTPAKGLYGVEESRRSSRNAWISDAQEKEDLTKLGAITKFYLKARPWANTALDYGDKPAEWSIYVLQPKHSKRSNGRKDCLRATLDSLIIRHDLDLLRDHLAKVHETTIFLDGTYQDRLSLNTFSMVLAINAVTSQRVGQDYMFDPRNRKALLTTVNNLKQASFFGGPFSTPHEISSAVNTAQRYLDNHKSSASADGEALTADDEALLREAIKSGHMALSNFILQTSKTFREVPFYVKDFPGGLGETWSLDESPGDPVLTNAPMIEKLQRFLKHAVDAPNSLTLLFETGRFSEEGREARRMALGAAAGTPKKGRAHQKGSTPRKASISASPAPSAAPGTQNTPGEASRSTGSLQKPLLSALANSSRSNGPDREADGLIGGVAAALARTRIISTASAKLTYLIDQIMKHHKEDKILVFYEHDVAWHVAYMLEIVDIMFRIYGPTLTNKQRDEYVKSFRENPKHRVMLMDIKLAAYGLDLQAASRIYFINPVLDPQDEVQAIGRARRIGQTKPVIVETLVLRGSLEEVIVRRKHEMTGAEQRKVHTILDDKPIYEWIKNPRFLPLPEGEVSGQHQMAMLEEPLFVFPQRRRSVDRNAASDVPSPLPGPSGAGSASTVATSRLDSTQMVARCSSAEAAGALLQLSGSGQQRGASSSRKRTFEAPDGPATPAPSIPSTNGDVGASADPTPSRPARRVRFG